MADNNSQNITKRPEGRPTKMTDDLVTKLESVFKLGVTDTVACNYAGISRESFYRWLKENEEFSYKIDQAKDYGRLAAGNVVMDAISKQKDVATARWWLEKKYPEEFQVAKDQIQVNTQTNILNIDMEALSNDELTNRIAEIEARIADLEATKSVEASKE